ncbi:GntR family transcriptional regulator [Parvularcula flava]|uniref:GntR family transcriptional regulator n=1 Tax=Aquisalinus luteolus TaxID=1566827 RepID=A0A8J3A0B7_9PROT|nr:GntR family transcriptional regulator [Aquisalinus luteolus]NHK26459.1 GntR family transcriptional regulator [Aquisalinus luteolus]GGH92397.1 GntR family transcriptional regulator [Aquisalinus luteolus]
MQQLSELIGPLDPEDRTALYLQLQKKLRTAIVENMLPPEKPLPAERDLAEEYGISRITVRKALQALVDEGLLNRRQGSGTIVARRVEKVFSQLTSFSEEMKARGQTPGSRWLRRAASRITPDEVMNYGLSPDLRVYRFDRVRHADGAPMALEYSIVPAFALPSPDAVEDSLYVALNEAGYRPVRALQRLRAVLFEHQQAELLGVPEKSAGLLVERRAFLQDGRIVEISRSFYRGDTYDFVAELTAG